MNPQDEQLHKRLEDLRRSLKAGEPAVSRKELLAVVSLIDEILIRSEAAHERLLRHESDFEERLLAIENSRFFHVLRLPGRLLLDWRGRLGQLLLHSPFHPLSLKEARPGAAVASYRSWTEREQPHSECVLDSQPLISIILPVHNPRQDWLRAAVQSVKNQTYANWQLCVCDDASSESWVQEYCCAQSGSDRRVSFTRSSTQLGVSGASNRAGELAGGEYVGFLDQDDLLASSNWRHRRNGSSFAAHGVRQHPVRRGVPFCRYEQPGSEARKSGNPRFSQRRCPGLWCRAGLSKCWLMRTGRRSEPWEPSCGTPRARSSTRVSRSDHAGRGASPSRYFWRAVLELAAVHTERFRSDRGLHGCPEAGL